MVLKNFGPKCSVNFDTHMLFVMISESQQFRKVNYFGVLSLSFKDIIGYDTLPQENINRDGQLIGDTTAPTVNPLELPYFMAATVGKFF